MNKIKLTQEYIIESEQSIAFKVNTFYEKYLYYSSNISKSMSSIYQLGSNLNGTPVNLWKEESLLTDFFIISEDDFDNIKNDIQSEEVRFIENLINKQQTILDTKKNLISSKIKIIRFESFINYLKSRTSK